MVRDEVLAVFLEEYAKETARLEASATDSQPQRDLGLMKIDRQIALAKAAILKGVDASMFIAEMRAWAERRGTFLAEAERAFKVPTPTNLLHADPKAMAKLRPLAAKAFADPKARNLLDQWAAEGLPIAMRLRQHAADHARMLAAQAQAPGRGLELR
ncbi:MULTISPECIES: hypothetical protein [unclassified Sphingomonas]|uniref:hypothetical protein n=1 Tax=unclassified Sphingomonas TaxID=196159 RepID=UPI0006FE1BCE|nr:MULTISPECIES: hypothetical protein [unclassified Sphingomonas]KQM98438.1 hypothetical protein ASE77_17870 [Sphingomonas sp. Leaf226]MDY0969232.1 hypothetical protein [Sphingomonas sp. CFBP9021]